MVADALSSKPANLNALMDSLPPELYEEIMQVNLVITDAHLANILEVAATLEEEIRSAQAKDERLKRYVQKMHQGRAPDFSMDQHGSLRFQGRLCVPNQGSLKKKILAEAHEAPYSIHLGGTKMYEDLRQVFWWDGMKKDIAYFVTCCNVCNKVKAEH